jgi:hypothetical protein
MAMINILLFSFSLLIFSIIPAWAGDREDYRGTEAIELHEKRSGGSFCTVSGAKKRAAKGMKLPAKPLPGFSGRRSYGPDEPVDQRNDQALFYSSQSPKWSCYLI